MPARERTDVVLLPARDGTALACHVVGTGPPLVCLPGGPMQASRYLGDLGGLAEHRQLIKVDLRGTGRSATPLDAGSYRCDRMVDDVESLREHLGLDRMDVLAHSAGANLAVLYAQTHPRRVSRLALVTPSVMAVGITVTAEVRRRTALRRRGERWYATASEALERIMAGTSTSADAEAVAPFFHGRWDRAAQVWHAATSSDRNQSAAAVFGADGAFEPSATRAALRTFPSPVLVLAGELDLNSPPPAMADVSALFPHGVLEVQPGAGHYPWHDDAVAFVRSVTAFLDRRPWG